MTAPSLAQRPSKALLIGLVVSGALALIVLAFMLIDAMAQDDSPIGFGLSALLAVAPLPLLLAAVLSLDRLEPEPKLHLAFAFAWGAGVGVALALALTVLGQQLFLRAGYGAAVVEDVGAVILAPVLEEALKGSALLLLLRRRREIDGLTDGIVYASMAGLGFAVVENVGYYLLAFREEGVTAAVQLFVIRGLIDPLGHPIYTSMVGLGVAYALTRHTPGRFAAVPLGYLGAVVLHGLWNGAATTGSLAWVAAAYFVIMGALVVLIVVTVVERRHLVAKMRTYLPGYQQTGLITDGDVTMLSTLSARKSARKWARRAGLGRAMGDYQQAATELTMLHLRAERQGLDPVRFALERDALLGAMANARRW